MKRFRSPSRVPVIHQLSEVECGSACLAMILSYHGRSTTLSQCRELAGASRDGLTAQAILDAARGEGLEGRALFVNAADRETVALPAIAHWKHRHFVVLERWAPESVLLVDPAVGRRVLSAAEFEVDFTGCLLVFERTPAFVERRPEGTRSIRRHFTALVSRTDRHRLAAIVVVSLLLQLLGLIPPAMTAWVVDRVIPAADPRALSIVALAIASAVATRAVVSTSRQWLLARVQRSLDLASATRFFRHLLSLPFTFFQQRSTGDLLVRLSSNGVIRDILTSQVLTFCLDGPLALGYLLVIAFGSPTLALLVLLLGVAQALGIWWSLSRQRDLSQRALAARSEEQGCAVEMLSGIALVKASAAEDRVLQRWQRLFTTQVDIAYETQLFTARLDVVLGGLRYATPLLLLWYGATEVLAGTLTTGQMIAANALAAAALFPLTSLVQIAQQLQTVSVYIDRVQDVLDAPPERSTGRILESAASATNPARAPGTAPALHIECRAVSFRFSNTAPRVLHDISLAIPRGQKVGIIGATGSGKSTLGMVLTGLLPAERGLVLHDGFAMDDLHLGALRRRCGIVMQDPQLFSGTIRQNIAFRWPDAPRERIIEAAEAAALGPDLRRMPMGLDTPIGERGASLSGGQRQRVALARALLERPELLVLDEATSHLDIATEALIDANLNRLSCTRIVIAHRLSTVRDADLLVLLEGGRVIEAGAPQELLAQQGAYWTLSRSAGVFGTETDRVLVPA